MHIPTRFTGVEEALHEAAIAATGLNDFGAPDYRAGLRELLASLDERPQRPPAARHVVWNTLLGSLVGRLFAHKGWRDHPDCLQRPLRAPLIVTGIPRTGTTALHKLLSMDDQFQGLEMWLTNFPMPRPPRDTWAQNPLYRATVANLDAFYEALPHFRAIHLMVADEVDECLEVLKHTFVSNRFGSSFSVPAYDRWWLAQDERQAYRYHADVLRLIGRNEPDKRWLLKNPGHVWSLDAVLAEYPDACIVHTHRDPAQAIASTCSTLEAAAALAEGAEVDPVVIGRREQSIWSEAMRRTMEVRRRHDPRRFFDVHQRELHADPMGVVRRIYRHFGLSLGESAEAHMTARASARPESSHGAHQYTLEHFGLSRDGIREAFGDYIRAFELTSV
jgi:hypothetical protein